MDKVDRQDLFFLAISRYKRQKYDKALELCDEFLSKNKSDLAAWLLKCKILTRQAWVDDLEIEDEGLADMIMGINEKMKILYPLFLGPEHRYLSL